MENIYQLFDIFLYLYLFPRDKEFLNLYNGHSVLIRNLIKLTGTAKLTAQGEGVVFLKDSKYILFEILENRTWKGSTIF